MAFYTHTQFFLQSPTAYTSGQMEERELWALRRKYRKSRIGVQCPKTLNLKAAIIKKNV